MLYTHLSLTLLVILTVAAIAACGGGDDSTGTSATYPEPSPAGSTSTSTEVSLNQEPTSAASAPTRGAASSAASTTTQGSTSSPTSAAPTALSPATEEAAPPRNPETPTEPPDPTDAPALAVLQVVTQRSCEDEFRQMLLDYDGAEEFGAEVVTRLSGEFMELRPDCLAQGWDPEFPVEPQVCETWEDLPSGITYKISESHRENYLSPTSRTSWLTEFPGFGEVEFVNINVHLNRVPLLSGVPEEMGAGPGSLVGGCWHYKGYTGLAGFWSMTYFKYTARGSGEDLGYVNRVRPWVIGRVAPSAFPECDSLLQAALEKELESGSNPDRVGVGDLVDRVRVMADGACDAEIAGFRGWSPMPAEGPLAGCPVSAPTGGQADGAYILHWPAGHYDGYGHSACWVMSPEGDWGAHMASGGGG